MSGSAHDITPAANQQAVGWRSITTDWASDQRAFKSVSWGKAMMWIFLLSDTFIFSCLLLSYMTVECPLPILAEPQRSLRPDDRRRQNSPDPDCYHDLRPD